MSNPEKDIYSNISYSFMEKHWKSFLIVVGKSTTYYKNPPTLQENIRTFYSYLIITQGMFISTSNKSTV